MKRLVALCVVGAVLSAGAFAFAGKQRRKTPARQVSAADSARAAMLQTDREFAKTGAARDLERFLSFVSDDVRVFPAGALATGKPAMREIWEDGFKDPNWSISWAPIAAEACSSGDMGYTTGSYETRSKAEDGSPVVRRGSYVTIWRKQADGSWKVVLDIGTPIPPPKPKANAPQPAASEH